MSRICNWISDDLFETIEVAFYLSSFCSIYPHANPDSFFTNPFHLTNALNGHLVNIIEHQPLIGVPIYQCVVINFLLRK